MPSVARSLKRGIASAADKLGYLETLRHYMMLYQTRRTGSPVSSHEEKKVIDEFVNTVQGGAVVWDVGARGGSYSRYARTTARPDAIHAFEPSPEFFSELSAVMEQLPGKRRYEAYQLALGANHGVVHFATEMPDHAPTTSGAIIADSELEHFDDENIIDVSIVPGDTIIEHIEPPTVLKIDVEGAELDVLRGLSDTIESGTVRAIFCEVHIPTEESSPSPSIRDFGAAPDDVHEFLESHGFRLTELQRRERDYHIKAVRN